MKQTDTAGRPVYLSAAEAARHLGLSPAAITMAHKRGHIQASAFSWVRHSRTREPHLAPLFDLATVEAYGELAKPNSPVRALRAENERLRAENEALKQAAGATAAGVQANEKETSN